MSAAAKVNDLTDSVNGIVIGGNDSYYEFWHVDVELNRLLDTPGKSRRIGRGCFQDDSAAEEYVKANYPSQYRTGIEMRAY